MITNKEKFLKELGKYFDQKISRNQLCNWAVDMRDQLITESELIKLENCLLYPMIVKLAISISGWESCNDEEIKEYFDIIKGEKNFGYFWYMKIPQSVKKLPTTELLLSLDLYEKNQLPTEDFERLLETLQNQKNQLMMDTITDLLFSNILNHILTLPFTKDLEITTNTCCFDSDELIVEIIINKTKDLILCYNGEKEFAVDMNVKNGNILLTIVL